VDAVIKGGYLVSPDLVPKMADILVSDGTITAIGADLDASAVIDATGLVVTPGFVDTHRHVVLAPLRGIGPDMSLSHYLTTMLGRIGSRHGVADVRNGVLLGAVEALDAGVTTVLDWSNVTSTPELVETAIGSLATSGIRAIFGHSNPDDVRRHAGRTGLVTTALAPLGPDYEAFDDVVRQIHLARELGLITSMHVGGGTGTRSIDRLHQAGLLGPDLNIVHGNMLDDDELKILADSGASLTVSTIVESVMGHGGPAYGRFVDAGGRPALGVDVVINNRPDMFSEMQATLRHERAQHGNGTPAAADLLRAATVDGARAVGLGEKIGSLTVGKRADIVLLDGLTHLLGIQQDGLLEGAVVTALGPENVRTVLVDGRVVKRDGVLVDHDLRALREATHGMAARILAD
jgi:5-methylthioadenosine/S-adenosylhomocysteine deaminase